MKAFIVRKQLRTSVQGSFSYFADGTWTTGKVWDLSEGGWRTTAERPLAIGLKAIAFLTLRDGEDLHHILIESAIVRWAHGRHAGWENLRIDALNQARLATVMEQGGQMAVLSEGMAEADGTDSSLPCQSLFQLLPLSVQTPGGKNGRFPHHGTGSALS